MTLIARRLLVPPASDPVVTLEEAKAHLRYDLPDEDALIVALVRAAEEAVARDLGLALLEQTWEIDVEPADASRASATYRLPHWPAQVTIVSAITSEAVTLLPEDAWHAYPVGDSVDVAVGTGAHRVTYKTGWPTPADVPAWIKQVIKVLVARWFLYREDLGQGADLAWGIERLLELHRPPAVGA